MTEESANPFVTLSFMMNPLYNIGIWCYTSAIALAATVNPKARLWHRGRKGLMERIEQRMATLPTPRVWIHVASLGEFEQARPIIEQIRQQQHNVAIVVTFFSPSGYEIRKEYPLADAIFYLPADTPHNAKRLLDIINPQIAIFIKYEYWLNYLNELRRREITTFLVSAIFRKESIFFKPWGSIWRQALATFSTIFVQNSNSQHLLKQIGIERVVVCGDTRFDRVMTIASTSKPIPAIESFARGKRLFVAGSTWPKDEEMIVELANNNPNIGFIIAPHELESQHITSIINRCRGGAIRYSEWHSCSDAQRHQVMILDTMGMLASAYRYATWAYIGGGFGAGIHNTLEPAVYGLPIAFGPRYHKFNEACEMISRGAARSIRNYEELAAWFEQMSDNATLWQQAHDATKRYTAESCGATARIMEDIARALKSDSQR